MRYKEPLCVNHGLCVGCRLCAPYKWHQYPGLEKKPLAELFNFKALGTLNPDEILALSGKEAVKIKLKPKPHRIYLTDGM